MRLLWCRGKELSQSIALNVVILEARRGKFVRIAQNFPLWLQGALGWSSQELDVHRKQVARARDFER